MKKVLWAILLLATSAFAQGNYTSPYLTAGAGLTLNYGSGTILQGGEAKPITGATLSMADTQTNCATPAFSSCNIVYWTAGTSLSVTQTIATANASGNVIVGYVKTTGGAITLITHANANIPTPAGVGALTGLTSNITPNVAAGVSVGTNALPFSSIFLGTAATNNFNFNPAATAAARTVTIADPGGAATLAYTNSTTVQPMTGLGSLSSLTAGTYDFGTALLPWFHLYLGTAATNNFVFTPASTTGARTITVADPGGAATLAYTNNTSLQTVSGLQSFTGNKAMLTSDFTSANAGGLQVITGLTITLPSVAANMNFHCALSYSQATNVAGDQFGVAVLTTAPTRLDAFATVATNATAFQQGFIANLGTTTPSAVITFQPGVTTQLVGWMAGTIQVAGGGAATFQLYILNGVNADVIVVKAGSYCSVI